MPFHFLPSRTETTLGVALSLTLSLGSACGGPPRVLSVVPGITVAVSAASVTDTVVFQRVITRAGRDSTAGTRTVVSRVVTGSQGASLLEVEQRFPAGAGQIVDTAVADYRTLRAVAHRSHQPTRIMRFDFVGDTAEGTVTAVGAARDAASPPEEVHQDLRGPLFDSNLLDQVVAALPLRPQFSAELPFFIYERGGRVAMPVRVRERARVQFPLLGEREVWVVTVGVPGAPATFWVDTSLRTVLRVRYEIAAAARTFTDERMTLRRRPSGGPEGPGSLL